MHLYKQKVFFLMIPFINLMYNGLESRKKKIILVGTFIVVAILPSLFNSFSFYETTQLWFKPENYDNLSKIFPNFWVTVYPFAYYFIGCYLREYRLKIKTIVLVILLVISIFLFGLLNLYRNFGSIWKTYPYADFLQNLPTLLQQTYLQALRIKATANKLLQALRLF